MTKPFTVLGPNATPLYKGLQCECYNWMLLNPTRWHALIYTRTGQPAPLRFSELRYQQHLNLRRYSALLATL